MYSRDRLQMRQAESRTLHDKCSLTWGDGVSSEGAGLLLMPQ